MFGDCSLETGYESFDVKLPRAGGGVQVPFGLQKSFSTTEFTDDPAEMSKALVSTAEKRESAERPTGSRKALNGGRVRSIVRKRASTLAREREKTLVNGRPAHSPTGPIVRC